MMKLLVTLFVALMGTVLSAEPVVHEVASIEDVEALPDGVTHVKCDRGVDNDVLEALGRVATLEHLNLNRCRSIDASGLAHLTKLARLRVLDLGMCRQLKDAALAEVGKLTSLEELNLFQGVQYTDEGMKPLRTLENLRSINVGMFWEASEKGLEHVLALPELESLDLRLNNFVTTEVLARIAETKPDLTRLNLRECGRRYGLDGFKQIARLSKLTWLDLGGHRRIPGEAMGEIAKLSELEHLNLIHGGLFGDEDLCRLEPLKKLKFLGLETMIDVTGECFETWQPPALEHLELKLNSLTTAGIRAVTKLKSLKRLYIWDYSEGDVDETVFGELGALENLEVLSIWWPTLSDASLKKIAGLPMLAELSLTGSDAITDKGITRLAALENIERISIMTCENVSDEALESLRTALPGCEVVREKSPS